MIQAVLTFPVFLLGLYGFGEWIRSRIFGDEPLSAGRVGRALAFGLLAHGLLMTILGFLCVLYPIVAGILSALPSILFWKFWLRDLRLLFIKATWKSSKPLNIVETVFIVILVFITLLRGFNALAPNISWDATSHHYLVPSVWLQNHSVSDLMSVIYSYYPSLTEMGIAGTMALGTDFLSNLYGWIFGLVAILLLIDIPVKHFSSGNSNRINTGRFAGITAAFIFTLFPGVGVQTSGGYVDLPLAVWVLATITFLLEFNTNRNWSNLIAAAFFSGAVLSTKHIGLLIFPGFLFILIWQLFSSKEKQLEKKTIWKFIWTFIGISILLPLPWYIRSGWLTGNPFYPFGIFGLPTPPHPPFTIESWVRPDYVRSIPGLLSYWLYLAFTPKIGDALGRNYSLLFPVLLPLVVFIPKLKSSGKLIAFLAGISILVIYAIFPVETRYHIPFIGLFAVVLGLLAAHWATVKPKAWHGLLFLAAFLISGIYLVKAESNYSWYALITIIISIIATVIWLAGINKKSGFVTPLILLLILGIGGFTFDIQKDLYEFGRRYKTVVNLEPEDRYMLRESPFNYGVIHYINTELDYENMRVLFLEPRVYRCKSDWVTWVGMDEPFVPESPMEAVAIAVRNNITHQLLGDDVSLKAMMYYNIIHTDGWGLPGMLTDEMVEYLEAHPDEDKVWFTRDDLNLNFLREDVSDIAPHFTEFWIPREIEKEQFPVEMVDGIEYYTAGRMEILIDPERAAQYAFIRTFMDWHEGGGLDIVYEDGLTILWKFNHENFMRLNPDIDWSEYRIDIN